MTSLALLGCGDAAKSVDVKPWFEGSAAALGDGPCGESAQPTKDRTLAVRVFASKGVDAALVEKQVAALRSHLMPYRIELEAAAPRLEWLSMPVLFAASAKEVEAALDGAALDDDADPDKVRAVVTDLVGRPLRGFLEKHAGESEADLNLVVLERIVGERSVVARSMPNAAGFTASPFLAEEAAAELADLGVAGSKTATIFLSSVELGRIERTLAMTTAAHELGHAFGLEHTDDRGNLMAVARSPRCRPVFTPADWKTIESRLETL